MSVVLALAAAAIGLVLSHLYRSVKARRPELPRYAVYAAVSGAVLVAVAGLVQAVAVTIEASSFAGSSDQSADAARDVLQGPAILASLLLRQIGVFALGFAFIVLALNGMRVGLLTRFMGVLGMIVGALFILPLGSSLPIVQAFWLVALGMMFLGRWPSGLPPAWVTGEAQPWPTQQEIREARMEKQAQKLGDEGGGAPAARSASARRAAGDAGARAARPPAALELEEAQAQAPLSGGREAGRNGAVGADGGQVRTSGGGGGWAAERGTRRGGTGGTRGRREPRGDERTGVGTGKRRRGDATTAAGEGERRTGGARPTADGKETRRGQRVRTR